MATPGSPASLLPPGEDEIPRRLRDIERSIMELGPSIAASIKPAMDDIRANVAALAAQDVILTAQDVVLTSQQATLAAQNAQILALIGQQSVFDYASPSVTNFAVPNTSTTYAPGSIPVPAGFTQALVDLSVYVGAVDSVGGVKYIYVSALINGVAGHEGIGGNDPASIAWVWASSRKITLLTGLIAGSTITIGALARTSDTGPWGANTSNRAYCDASVTFLR